MKDAKKIVLSASILANAYAYAKAGKSQIAGKLLVQASEDGNLDEVMDGIAQSVENMEEGALEAQDDFEEEDALEATSKWWLKAGSDEDDDDDDDDDEDNGELDAGSDGDDDDEDPVEVDLPESVARLAARAEF